MCLFSSPPPPPPLPPPPPPPEKPKPVTVGSSSSKAKASSSATDKNTLKVDLDPSLVAAGGAVSANGLSGIKAG